MIELIRRMMPDAVSVEEQHGSGRTRHLRVTTADGRVRPCVLRRAPRRERRLYETWLTPAETGAPLLLGAVDAEDPHEAWLLLEALPERFPDFAAPADVTACFRHLADMHVRFEGRFAAPGGHWAIAAAEIRQVLQALPDTAHLAAEAGALLTAGPLTLVQGDYHRWNLLLEEGLVRVLDWEHAAFATPVWDLLLLAPEEPGWDGAPRGALAGHALRTYHEAGPLARLSWNQFLQCQRLARIFVATRWYLAHQAKAALVQEGGLRDQVIAHAEAERSRINRLLRLL